MTRLKIWLILISLILIFLDKHSFISKIRDYSAIYTQKQISLLVYRIKNYPKLVLLQKSEQRQLEEENIKLKKQIEQYDVLLKQQVNQTKDTKDIQALKLQSNLYENFHIYIAKAVIDVNYLVNNRLLIDRGIESGVQVGNAVVNKEGVIGQITITNPNNAQVTLITNPDYKIYLQNNPNKSKMLAQGIGNSNLLVKYINKSEKIKPGDILYTTGLDDIYPANLPVARITKVLYDNNGFNSAICEPVVDFNKLQYILVLKNAN